LQPRHNEVCQFRRTLFCKVKKVSFRSFELLVFHISIPLAGKNHSKFLSDGEVVEIVEKESLPSISFCPIPALL
jgi:hypothetical protein